MQVFRSSHFKRWVDEQITHARSGDPHAILITKYVLDELNYLKALPGEPEEETASLKRVRQSGIHRVWRLSHPYHPEVAVRIICWFDPDSDTAVVALLGANKAGRGDVFYDSVGSRADQIIAAWNQAGGGQQP